MSSNPRSLLLLLQYGDSAFPAGGFVNSWGLEAAAAEGHVTDAASLAAACRMLVTYQVGRTDAVAAAAAARAGQAQDLGALVALDRRLSATRAAREPREASTRMGRRLIEVAAGVEANDWLLRLRTAVRDGEMPGNHAVILGAVAGSGEEPPLAAATLILWGAANGFLSAGLRLLRVTHTDTQAILTGLRPLLGRLAGDAVEADSAAMAGGAPRLEIWAMRHETGAARLFAS